MTPPTHLLQLPARPDGAPPPSRLPVSQAGPLWQGKDGRSWSVNDPVALLRALSGHILILDENHSSFYDAPRGMPSPAMARLSDFRLDANGVIWAEQVEWTAGGLEKFEQGAYLGLSPVVLFQPTSQTDYTVLGDVVDIHSIALVNDPNLPLPALNIAQTASTMDPKTPSEPSIGQVIADAIKAAVEPLVTGVEALSARLEKIEATPAPEPAPAVATAANAAHVQLVEHACRQLVSAGKIAPNDAARARFVAMCDSPEKLAAELAFYETQAPIVTNIAPNLSAAPTGKGHTATELQAEICRKFGKDPAKLFPETN